MTMTPRTIFEVCDLTMAYGSHVIQQDLSFEIMEGSIFVIMGGSGCGKSTLLRHLIGLQRPASGKILFNQMSFWDADQETRDGYMRSFGVLYQQGALWSSLTLAQNIALPIEMYTSLSTSEIADLVSYKLSLVGLGGYEAYYPSEISGGMRKRAGLARALALDPKVLFFDEPSAGLDPISSRRLDDLIGELRDSLGATVVIVTHELDSIFAIATDSVFLDAETKTMIGEGDPRVLRDQNSNEKIHEFLTRGGDR